MPTTTTNPTTTPRVPMATPKVSQAKVKDLDPRIIEALQEAQEASRNGTLSGADIASALIATGHMPNVGTATKAPRDAQGLKVRTYMRKAAGAWVGKGGTYTGTVNEAARVAYGYLNGVPAPKGGRFIKGVWVETPAKDDATDA